MYKTMTKTNNEMGAWYYNRLPVNVLFDPTINKTGYAMHL